ncbi:MAG: FecR domain-containing protein [Saprospiraceae bacterium]
MSIKESITKELIFEHFNHKTSPIQRKMIYDWLLIRQNEELYYEWLEEWERMSPQYVIDSDRLTGNYLKFLAQTPNEKPIYNNQTRIIPKKTPSRRVYWSVAASLFLLISVSTYLFSDDLQYKTYKTGFGEIEHFILADSTMVTLNANSSLRISRLQFNRPARQVYLNGEAKFSVSHKVDNEAFLVKTENDFDVKVLGTEFEVYARHQDRKVVLNKGKVQLQYPEGTHQKQVLLQPGDHFELNQISNTAKTNYKPLKEFASWTQKRFVFDEKSLQEVALMLKENYDLDVEIQGKKLADRVIMGSFVANNEDELLLSLSELLDINILKEGKHVQLIEK